MAKKKSKQKQTRSEIPEDHFTLYTAFDTFYGQLGL